MKVPNTPKVCADWLNVVQPVCGKKSSVQVLLKAFLRWTLDPHLAHAFQWITNLDKRSALRTRWMLECSPGGAGALGVGGTAAGKEAGAD